MRLALVAATALLLFLAPSHEAAGQQNPEVRIPELGDASARVLGLKEERDLSREVRLSIMRQAPLIDDPAAQDYLDRLGQRLLAASGERRYARGFNFFIIDDPSINAFAAPAAAQVIAVFTGMIDAARLEYQFAGVLAHEIAHVSQRHISRRFEAQSQSSLALAAALIAGLALGASGHGDAAEAAIFGSMAGSAQAQVNYTRRYEYEADRVGLRILAEGGFDPEGIGSFFERVQQINRYNDLGQIEYLRTHPVDSARIAEARARAEDYPDGLRTDSLDYQLFRARVIALSNDDQRAVAERFQADANSGSANARYAAQYGRALALARLGQHDQALELLDALRDTQEHIWIALAKADVHRRAGDVARALDVLEANRPFYEGFAPLVFAFADTLLEADRAVEARELLRRQIGVSDSPNPEIYKRLSEAEFTSGRRPEAFEALAQYYLDMGQAREALRQLELALSLPALNPVQQARLEARRDQLEFLIRERRAG